MRKCRLEAWCFCDCRVPRFYTFTPVCQITRFLDALAGCAFSSDVGVVCVQVLGNAWVMVLKNKCVDAVMLLHGGMTLGNIPIVRDAM